jgi:hypothetical protein
MNRNDRYQPVPCCKECGATVFVGPGTPKCQLCIMCTKWGLKAADREHEAQLEQLDRDRGFTCDPKYCCEHNDE